MASKIEAYEQRGASDKRLSADFEDIVYVLENRPEIVEEVVASRSDIRDYIVEFMASLLHGRVYENQLALKEPRKRLMRRTATPVADNS